MFTTRSTFLALATLIQLGGLVRAQGISDLPQCAQGCATTAAKASGCAVTDVTCLCTSSSFFSAAAQCAELACSASDLATAQMVFNSACASVGSSSGGASGSASASPSGAGPSSAGSSGSAPVPPRVTTITQTFSNPPATSTIVTTLPATLGPGPITTASGSASPSGISGSGSGSAGNSSVALSTPLLPTPSLSSPTIPLPTSSATAPSTSVVLSTAPPAATTSSGAIGGYPGMGGKGLVVGLAVTMAGMVVGALMV